MPALCGHFYMPQKCAILISFELSLSVKKGHGQARNLGALSGSLETRYP